MIIQTSYNLNFAIFPDEKFDQEKIISERLNKTPNFENTNHKLFLNQNHKETISMMNSNSQDTIYTMSNF